jgi:parvulin-like peptidyl-prolyl isomerase
MPDYCLQQEGKPMSSQTERQSRRPPNARPAKSPRSNKSNNKPNKYYRQTARGIETRRDGKPLIFGWGKHLSHSEKMKIQRRATWAFTGLIIFIIVGTLLGTWIYNNVIVPGEAITTVNGHQIPQSEFRKMVMLDTLIQYDKLNGKSGLNAQHSNLEAQNAAVLKTIDSIKATLTSLNSQIAKLPKGPSAKRTQLNNEVKAQNAALSSAEAKQASLSAQITTLTTQTIPLFQQTFDETQVASDSVEWLQDDELIREWLATQSVALQNQINPTPAAVQHALNALAADLPASASYNSLLNQMGVTDSDMHAMMTIKLRRDNMQNYLASQIKSPAYQVHVRSMTIDTLAHAQAIYKQLLAADATNFAALARKNSQDSSSASNGGDLGWLVRYQDAQSENTGVVDDWLFDPHRYVGELSPILSENGVYRILQILSIDPSRPVPAATLQTLKGTLDNPTALSDWLLDVKAEPQTQITQANSNMMSDTNNMPPTSILPANPPAQSTNPTG